MSKRIVCSNWNSLGLITKVVCCPSLTISDNLDSGKGQRKRLLDGINGTVNGGEMIAVMGASGAGKTTLMEVLSGLRSSACSGIFKVNGQSVSKYRQLMRRISG